MNHTTNIKPPWALNKSPECFFWQYYDLKNMIFDDTTDFNWTQNLRGFRK